MLMSCRRKCLTWTKEKNVIKAVLHASLPFPNPQSYFVFALKINWQGCLSVDSSPVSRLEMDDMSGRILFPLSSVGVGGRVKLKGKLGSVISEYDSFWEPSIDMQIPEPIAYSIEMLFKVEPSSLIREEDMRELKENYLLPTLHM
ncbi:hypothetical protein YC2023_122452 [Brassica napus]